MKIVFFHYKHDINHIKGCKCSEYGFTTMKSKAWVGNFVLDIKNAQ